MREERSGQDHQRKKGKLLGGIEFGALRAKKVSVPTLVCALWLRGGVPQQRDSILLQNLLKFGNTGVDRLSQANVTKGSWFE